MRTSWIRAPCCSGKDRPDPCLPPLAELRQQRQPQPDYVGGLTSYRRRDFLLRAARFFAALDLGLGFALAFARAFFLAFLAGLRATARAVALGSGKFPCAGGSA